MKNINVTINDEFHGKLAEIMKMKDLPNRAEALEFLIKEVHKRLKKGGGD